MRIPPKSIAAFLLMTGGIMGVGAVVNSLNTVGVEVSIGGLVFGLLLAIYAYIGFYTYNYLAYGKGNVKVAFGMALVTSILGVLALILGYDSQQKFFTLYELINYIAPWFVAVAIFPDLRK